MEKFKEVISKSLIDFEEIKYILANNNSKLVKSINLKERYFLNNNISFKNANYKTILENSFIITSENNRQYLTYKSKSKDETLVSKIEVLDDKNCVDFLHHLGYTEVFTIEKNIYTYSNSLNEINIINIIDSGLYLGINKNDSSKDKLIEVLDSFNLPYGEVEENETIEKNIIAKVRRYI